MRPNSLAYGTTYGMFKTTIYLPDELKAALRQLAGETGQSESELIREGVQLAVARRRPPTPTLSILVSDDPHFAESADDHLAGFGRQ
jgi:Arc/MetJ-type ribon-helix-helix transcriptional regulator